MDAFESVVATILEREGFWTRTLMKVNLTKEEKRQIGRPSSPRWEIDIVAYRPGDNLLRIVECKSYLDSRGVRMSAFQQTGKGTKRFKLFNEPETRRIVLQRLVQQLQNCRLLAPNPEIELCLAAGKIVASDQEKIRQHFEEQGWKLLTPQWIRQKLTELAEGGYENEVAALTAKLILR